MRTLDVQLHNGDIGIRPYGGVLSNVKDWYVNELQTNLLGVTDTFMHCFRCSLGVTLILMAKPKRSLYLDSTPPAEWDLHAAFLVCNQEHLFNQNVSKPIPGNIADYKLPFSWRADIIMYSGFPCINGMGKSERGVASSYISDKITSVPSLPHWIIEPSLNIS